MIAWLRLLRVGTLFSPAADVVAGACLVGTEWSGALVRAVVASVGVYAAGMVLNDHADRHVDRIHRPERPIPSGEVAPAAALAVGLALLALAVALSPIPVHHGALAAGVLFYDYVVRRLGPAVGALTMGALRAGNLLAGALVGGGLAASTAVATPGLPDPRAVWIAAGVYAVYIVSVTVLGIFEDEPRVAPRAVVAVQAAPALAAPLALLALPKPWPAAAIGFALAAAFAIRVRRQGRTWDRDAIRRSMTWLLLGTMFYTSLLCLGSGRPFEALAIAAAIGIARHIARAIALT